MLSLWVVVTLVAAPEPLVEVTSLVPDALIDLRYATDDNFMHHAVYPPTAKCLLLARSARMLVRAAEALRSKGFRLRLYDCYRPSHVQYELWKVMPVPGYVANPKTGSNHSRGGAIDLSLVTLDGGDVLMPSPYDFFGKAAHHSYSLAPPEALEHREVLRAAMEAAGFAKNPMEWWHYDLPDARQLPLRDDPF